MSEQRFCKNCKHVNRFSSFYNSRLWECNHPGNHLRRVSTGTVLVSQVSGKPILILPLCEDQREENTNKDYFCGYDGRRYEESLLSQGERQALGHYTERKALNKLTEDDI